MRELFRKKHVLWLRFLYGAFSLPKSEEFDLLYDFAQIEFRHLKWLAKEIVNQGGDFDWERESFSIVHKYATDIYESLEAAILATQKRYGVGALYNRMRSDEEYILETLRRLQTKEVIEIKAFDRSLLYEGLDEKSLNALVQFLFEESYKEYELIVTYFYSQRHTEDAKLYSIFEDLIYESIYHLKSFATLMAKLGILSLPRVVMREVYMFDDLKTFLEKGIEEEKAAKEQCKLLSSAIKNKELSQFFSYIDNQEDYHIELMQEAIGSIS